MKTWRWERHMLGAGQTGRRELGTDMLKMHCRKLSKNKYFFLKILKSPTSFHIYYRRCFHRYLLLMDYFSRPALLIFCSGTQAHLCVPQMLLPLLETPANWWPQWNGTLEAPERLPFFLAIFHVPQRRQRRERVWRGQRPNKQKCIKNKWWCALWLPFAQAKHLTVRQLHLVLEVS